MAVLLEKNHFQGIVLRKDLNLSYLLLYAFCLRRTKTDGIFYICRQYGATEYFQSQVMLVYFIELITVLFCTELVTTIKLTTVLKVQ